jgi:hypothetical protein
VGGPIVGRGACVGAGPRTVGAGATYFVVGGGGGSCTGASVGAGSARRANDAGTTGASVVVVDVDVVVVDVAVVVLVVLDVVVVAGGASGSLDEQPLTKATPQTKTNVLLIRTSANLSMLAGGVDCDLEVLEATLHCWFACAQ